MPNKYTILGKFEDKKVRREVIEKYHTAKELSKVIEKDLKINHGSVKKIKI